MILTIAMMNISSKSYSCTTPTGLSTTLITSTTAKLNWGTTTDAVTYYARYRITGTFTWTSTTVSTNSLSLTGLLPGISYEWKVRTNCSGSNSTYSSILTFNTLCATTSGLSTTNITNTTATLNWGSTPCDSFLLRYYVTSVPNTVFYQNISPGTATSYNLTGLTVATNYSWLIRTYCMNGQAGSYSSTMTFTTLGGTCSTPTGQSTSSITSSGASLSWAAVTGALSYNIQYKLSSGSSWTSTTSTTNSKSLAGLAAASAYVWQVQTVCSGGTSSWTASASFTTLAATCSVPTGMTTTSITSSGGILNWAAVSGALSYNVQYKLSSGSSWTSTTSSSASKTLSGLGAASAYVWQVQTVCSGGTSPWTSSASFTTSNSTILPTPDHIVILIEENHGYTQIMGSSSAPYINALAADAMSTSFTQMYGIEHPSQPNYLDLFSGSNQGITNNNLPSSHFTTPNLARELINAGKTFITYSQSLPSAGSDAATSGKYARKHNPITNWMGTGTNQVSSTLNLPFTSFPSNYTTLPTVSFVVPDMDYDMHDGTITTGDTWFHTYIDGYVQWAKTHNSLFIMIFDEDNGSYSNRIPCIFTGPMVKSGTVSTTYNLYNVLRTIEDMYGTTHAGNAAGVSAIHGCWLNGYKIADVTGDFSDVQWNIFPNPATDLINIQYELTEKAPANFTIYNNVGQVILEQSTTVEEEGSHQISLSVKDLGMTKGIYFVEMIVNEKKYLKKVAVVE
ncbi:MAG: fibronectin type III domain-containing protein [Bacteroidetes bacterium]|nr:fibronectin type III domain-containing protein [Bacteroidota bacterium]